LDIDVSGYTQARYDRVYVSPGAPTNEEADPGLSAPARVFVRRARVKLEGDALAWVHFYLQPELANVVHSPRTFAELRDAWVDLALEPGRTLRLRVGQSKVPFGFENMQSSQDRVAFDRSDAINSAMPGERDVGAFVLFAPAEVRRRFASLSSTVAKGSGDYGAVALGVFSGQGPNQLDASPNKHLLARVTWPFAIAGRHVELSAGGNTGRFAVSGSEGVAPRTVRDVRGHATLYVYPEPIGLQVEYNVGVGPELAGDRIEERPLDGGYAMLLAHVGPTFPYVRGQRYDGGWKTAAGSPRRVVHELEAGVEVHVAKPVEVTTSYLETARDYGDGTLRGRYVRVQIQINY
jgi:hypothetical protein